MKVLLSGGGGTLYLLRQAFLAKGRLVTIGDSHADECIRLPPRLEAIGAADRLVAGAATEE